MHFPIYDDASYAYFCDFKIECQDQKTDTEYGYHRKKNQGFRGKGKYEMKDIFLCLINTLLMVCGQILFKLGSTGKTISKATDIISLLFSPIILLALAVYGLTTLLWLYILSRVKISYAYPIQALAFPIVLIVSALIFHEEIPINRWLGVAIIVIGVYVAIFR